jgi:hypothetical protein
MFLYFAISRRRAPQKRPKQEFELFERSEFLNSRAFRGAQGSSVTRNQVNGCPFFWFVFFGQAKKMNIEKHDSICNSSSFFKLVTRIANLGPSAQLMVYEIN